MKKKNKWIYLTVSILSVIILIGLSRLNNKSVKNNADIESEKNYVSENPNEEKDLNEKVPSESVMEAELGKLENIKNDPLFILVNKENLLDDTYEPSDLVLSDIEFLSYIETRNLSGVTANAAKEMFEAAAEDGIILLGASGYRSYNIQVNLFNGRAAELGVEEASQYTAPPGASEHQTGLALDILGDDYQFLDDGFEESQSFNWLKNNCYKYGFILRYVQGKEEITGFGYEPWHFRYIGDSEIAKDIMDRGISFEEYLMEVDKRIEEIQKN